MTRLVESMLRLEAECGGGGLNGFGITDFPEELWDPTFDQSGFRRILVSYMTDGNARRTSALTEVQRLTTFLDRMEKIFPGVDGSCEGGTSWSRDEEPYSRGAFAIPRKDK
jgi:monoamine oxidase